VFVVCLFAYFTYQFYARSSAVYLYLGLACLVVGAVVDWLRYARQRRLYRSGNRKD